MKFKSVINAANEYIDTVCAYCPPNYRQAEHCIASRVPLHLTETMRSALRVAGYKYRIIYTGPRAKTSANNYASTTLKSKATGFSVYIY